MSAVGKTKLKTLRTLKWCGANATGAKPSSPKETFGGRTAIDRHGSNCRLHAPDRGEHRCEVRQSRQNYPAPTTARTIRRRRRRQYFSRDQRGMKCGGSGGISDSEGASAPDRLPSVGRCPQDGGRSAPPSIGSLKSLTLMVGNDQATER